MGPRSRPTTTFFDDSERRRYINELRQPGGPSRPSRFRPSLGRFRVGRRENPSLLADIQERAGASTMPPEPSRSEGLRVGLSVYPPSDHGRAMDDPNTDMIAASASPEAQHVAVEPRRPQARLTLRQPTVQIRGEGGDWQPGDLQGVPNSSGYTLSDNTTLQVTEDAPTLTRETLTPPSPTETIPDAASGVSEVFDTSRNRQQSNYSRARQEGPSVPLPNCHLSDTDDDSSVANDEGNDNFSEQFFDVDGENDNGPRSLKTMSKRSCSSFWSASSSHRRRHQ